MARCQVALSVLWVLVVVLLCASFVTSLTSCPVGTHKVVLLKGESPFCQPCTDGTFMPFDNHQYTECTPCNKIEDATTEILITQCTKTNNTVINCVEGYYRRLPMNIREKERCEKCTKCSYPTLPTLSCGTYQDTYCCNGENYEVYPDENGVLGCFEKPRFCKEGTYFVPLTFECLPCPSGTFMSESYHTRTACWECANISNHSLPKNSVIISACNTTHDTTLGCKDGFYVNSFHTYNSNEMGCQPCKACNESGQMYEGRKCEPIHDTVCCTQPNMTVVDTPAGPQCTNPSTSTEQPTPTHTPTHTPTPTKTPEVPVCARDEYLHIDKNNRTAVCLPCPFGTFIDESNHAMTVCKNSTEFVDQQQTSSSGQKETDQESDDHIIGLIVGLVIAAVVVGGLLVGVLCYFQRSSRKRYGVCWMDEHKEEMEPLLSNNDRDNRHQGPNIMELRKKIQEHDKFILILLDNPDFYRKIQEIQNTEQAGLQALTIEESKEKIRVKERIIAFLHRVNNVFDSTKKVHKGKSDGHQGPNIMKLRNKIKEQDKFLVMLLDPSDFYKRLKEIQDAEQVFSTTDELKKKISQKDAIIALLQSLQRENSVPTIIKKAQENAEGYSLRRRTEGARGKKW